MHKMMLAAGAAMMALAAPAVAQGKHGGGNHGGGHGGGHGGQAHAEKSHGNKGHGEMRGSRGMSVKAAHADRGPRMQVRGDARHDQGERTHNRTVMTKRDWQGNDDRDGKGRGFLRLGDNDHGRGLMDGCPPGLAMKNNGCLPPGQAKKLVGASVPSGIASAMLEGPYRNWYRDDSRYYYRMGDGVIYRVARDNNLVSALFPAYEQPYSYYPVGGYYPSDYNYYNVPYQYQQYYPDGGNMLYRYNNGAIYGLDPKTMAVQSIVALLAGDLSVGQALPQSYSVYNVPMNYRGQYYDTPDAWYRYNDGYIYRVDPKTQLITAVISALV